MSLFFKPSELADKNRGLTFDDVLLVPNKSEIKSRKDPNTQTQLTQKYKTDIPIISANMDTVTETEMCIAMNKLGGTGILHRFMEIPEQVNQAKKIKNENLNLRCASIGVSADFKERAKALVEAEINCLTLDIAHGHSDLMIETVTWVKTNFPEVEIIAGNVATPEAVKDLAHAGAQIIKVGIGPGSMCTTRIMTGCGVPQLTALSLCAKEAKKQGVLLIADGGIKTSGDILKALVCGADSVMVGSLLSGTLETPGKTQKGKKLYRGMASRSAQESWRGVMPKGMAPEGESTWVAVKGHVETVIEELMGGVRSGMSYLNAHSLQEARENARFIEISSNTVFENRAHGVRHFS